jgi:hypothetical protein
MTPPPPTPTPETLPDEIDRLLTAYGQEEGAFFLRRSTERMKAANRARSSLVSAILAYGQEARRAAVEECITAMKAQSWGEGSRVIGALRSLSLPPPPGSREPGAGGCAAHQGRPNGYCSECIALGTPLAAPQTPAPTGTPEECSARDCDNWPMLHFRTKRCPAPVAPQTTPEGESHE